MHIPICDVNMKVNVMYFVCVLECIQINILMGIEGDVLYGVSLHAAMTF